MKRASMKISVLLLSILLLLSAPALAAETVLNAADADGAAATLTLSSKPLLSMTPTALRLTMDRAHGDTLLATSAVCDLTMPAMSMPENRPLLECNAIGCSGSAIFTMAGAWDVTCDVSFSSGKTSRFLFVIEMVQLK
jgi:hypothetical protein